MEIKVDLSKVPTKTRIVLAKMIEDKRALDVLAEDEDFHVREAVSKNPLTPKWLKDKINNYN